MTMSNTITTLLPLPDPPERDPDDMTSFQHLSETGSVHHLIQYLGNPDTTIVSGERYIVAGSGASGGRPIVPDLFVAFNADPARYRQHNGYVIARQGKPPDFVLEIASRTTGRNDVTIKPGQYAELEIPEYWRFDETGSWHGTRLAGDRLVNGVYQPITIDRLAPGILQGHSAALNVLIRWENGQLRWHDPATGQPIPTFTQERQARLQAQGRADAAEARVRELEATLERERRNRQG